MPACRIADRRFVLSKLMQSHHYRVVEAADGAGALEAGCDEYLAKPLDFDELTRLVERLIGR